MADWPMIQRTRDEITVLERAAEYRELKTEEKETLASNRRQLAKLEEETGVTTNDDSDMAPFLVLDNLGNMFKENSDAHGFNDPPQTMDQTLLLIISEAIETFEDDRNGIEDSGKLPGFTAVEEEFADMIIRILDQAAVRGLRIGEAVYAKHHFNKARPFRHGKRF